jgi:hypothetical protein
MQYPSRLVPDCICNVPLAYCYHQSYDLVLQSSSITFVATMTSLNNLMLHGTTLKGLTHTVQRRPPVHKPTAPCAGDCGY